MYIYLFGGVLKSISAMITARNIILAPNIIFKVNTSFKNITEKQHQIQIQGTIIYLHDWGWYTFELYFVLKT